MVNLIAKGFNVVPKNAGYIGFYLFNTKHSKLFLLHIDKEINLKIYVNLFLYELMYSLQHIVVEPLRFETWLIILKELIERVEQEW